MKKNIIILVIIALASCQPKARRPILVAGNSMEQSVKRNQNRNQIEELLLKKYRQRDSITTYHNSNSGFWYANTSAKKNKKNRAKTNDIVIFAHQIKDLNNTVLYSFSEIGKQQYKVDKQDIITGLQEGLKLMNEGDEFTFLFPSYKAFGYAGDGNKIGSNQPLIYNVKLLKINKYENN
ncbi:MAG: gliding motility-associated peptidyl-prolyl isomerase GldI [Flavobacteriaceae bacterium]|nr:gliding motility-associated peptidyl-prolyl isomerase GldI [Flavobacteriaceae bacterium]